LPLKIHLELFLCVDGTCALLHIFTSPTPPQRSDVFKVKRRSLNLGCIVSKSGSIEVDFYVPKEVINLPSIPKPLIRFRLGHIFSHKRMWHLTSSCQCDIVLSILSLSYLRGIIDYVLCYEYDGLDLWLQRYTDVNFTAIWTSTNRLLHMHSCSE